MQDRKKKIQCIANWSSWRASWCISTCRGGSSLSAQWHSEIAAPSPLGMDGCEQGLGLPTGASLPANGPAGAQTCWEQDCPSCTQLQHVCRLCSRSAVVTWGCLGQLAEVAVKAFFPYFFSELRVFWVTQPSYTLWYMCVVLQLLFAGNAHALHALREKGQKRVSPSALLFNMSQSSASVLLKSACKF